MSHADHQVPDANSAGSREGVAGMAQIVEVHGWQSG